MSDQHLHNCREPPGLPRAQIHLVGGSGDVVEFGVLGPVEVRADGGALTIGPPQQRQVLAALLTDAGRTVTTEALIGRVWDEAPSSARRTLQVYIARLRRLLKQDAATDRPRARLVPRSGGYVLDVESDQVDLHRFRRLVERGRDRRCPDTQRAKVLREARGLWRGEPLAGLPGEWAARMRAAWHQEYLDAAFLWAQAEVAIDNPTAVIGPLTELVGEYPLVESLVAMLMRALYAAGRPADALDRYTKIRQHLVEQLGTDPGAELQRLHQAILRGDDVSEAVPVAAPHPASPAVLVPAQLPGDVYGFVGRHRETVLLDQVLDSSTVGQRTAVVISALSGTAGVGKTALALHWAHRAREKFPDGQLYVNLRGFGPYGPPLAPAEVLRQFLGMLGVSPGHIPADLDSRARLYRSLLADRRVLVLLDNARDAEQVRPLVPGAPTAMVLVTSRDWLSSLIAVEGARPLTLDLLTPAEGRDLLAGRIGEARLAAEPGAVDEIIMRCARLPLALAVVAARAAIKVDFPLHTVAVELRAARRGLDAFAGEDPASDVRAVFSWSYQALSPPAARLFRLLGLHTGVDISTFAAASLAGLRVEQAEPLLAELTRAHLVMERVRGRYTFHDLLHAYAVERASAEESAHNRAEAIRRLLDWYLHSADAAARVVMPNRHHVALPDLSASCHPLVFTDHEQALAWCIAELGNLVAATELAAGSGEHSVAWMLPAALWGFFFLRKPWSEWIHACRIALASAQRIGDQHGQAWSLFGLGAALRDRRQSAEAADHYDQALPLWREIGDRHGEAMTLNNLAAVCVDLGRHDEAQRHIQLALQIRREVGDRRGEGQALHNLGNTHLVLGRLEMAVNHFLQALDVRREMGDRYGEAMTLEGLADAHCDLGRFAGALEYGEQTLQLRREIGDLHGEACILDGLGFAHHHLGQQAEALYCYQHALDLHRKQGDRHGQAITLARLGDTHHAAGDLTAARQAWQQALALLRELEGFDQPVVDRGTMAAVDAEEISLKLRDLNAAVVESAGGTAPPRTPPKATRPMPA